MRHQIWTISYITHSQTSNQNFCSSFKIGSVRFYFADVLNRSLRIHTSIFLFSCSSGYFSTIRSSAWDSFSWSISFSQWSSSISLSKFDQFLDRLRIFQKILERIGISFLDLSFEKGVTLWVKLDIFLQFLIKRCITVIEAFQLILTNRFLKRAHFGLELDEDEYLLFGTA